MSTRVICSGIVLAGLLVAVGCNNSQSRVGAPSFSASGAASRAMQQYDTDNDGKLNAAELDKCPAIKSALSLIDTDGDGAVSKDELDAQFKKWQDSRLGRVTAQCVVLHRRRPLADAEVKYVPEKFLGDGYPGGSGTTDSSGSASISIPVGERDARGMPLGFYRVEITKAGEKIPAKYNTDTILGAEVGPEPTKGAAVFKLQY